jgi:hypothetical protein
MSEEHSPASGPYLVATADRSVWPAGAIITGDLVVTNPAVEDRLAFRTGSPAVGTLATLSGTPVGNNNRPHRGVGRRIDLAPGDTATIRFVCASSNLDLAQGTTLPPGDYLLTVHLRGFSEPTQGRLEAPPVPIRLE